MEGLFEERGPAEVVGVDAANGVGGHDHVLHFFTTICSWMASSGDARPMMSEPRHGAGQRDQHHRLGVVDDWGQPGRSPPAQEQ